MEPENIPTIPNKNFEFEFLVAMLAVFFFTFIVFYLGVPFIAQAFN